MKKCILFLLIALLLNSAVAFAALPYDEIMSAIKDDGEVDLSAVDQDNIVITDYLDIWHLENGTERGNFSFFVTLPMKDTNDIYTAVFSEQKLTDVLKNSTFSMFEPLKYFSKDEAKAYFSKSGLGKADEIKSFYLQKREGVIFAYEIICKGKSYIIPYYMNEWQTKFNVNDDPDCELEVGKVYTFDEFREININENNQYKQWASAENAKQHLHYKKDGEEYCTWDCTDVDHALHLGKGTDEPEIIDDNEKTDTKKDTEKEPDKKTDDKEDNIKDDQKDTEKEPANDTDVKKDDTDKPGEIKKPTGKTPDVTFSDVPKDHWAYDDITSLAKKSVILGYGDGKFGVDDSVTHEQLSLLLKRQFNYDETDRTAQPAKRDDIIVSLVKALNADLSSVDTADVSKFSDADSISADDEQYIAYAVKSGLVLGYDGSLNLADNVTRAETAALICRAMKLAK